MKLTGTPEKKENIKLFEIKLEAFDGFNSTIHEFTIEVYN